jgi:hypothetical protein
MRAVRPDLLQALPESPLHVGKVAIVILHLIAEQQLADFVDAHYFIVDWRGILDLDRCRRRVLPAHAVSVLWPSPQVT